MSSLPVIYIILDVFLITFASCFWQ